VSHGSGCSACQDLQYRTTGKGRYAIAEVCPRCSAPCTKCNDEERIIGRDDAGRTWVSPCSCVALKRRVRLFGRAKIPAAYHDKNVEHPSFSPSTRSQAEAQRRLMKFQARGEPGDAGLLLMGPPGIGKTHLMCGIIRFLTLERGQECRYIDSFHLLEELRATFEARQGASALMEAVCSVPILVLDELGKTRTTGWQREVLDQIISRRYSEQLTTFMTSNYGMPAEAGQGGTFEHDNLKDRVGTRIFSRLMEMCEPLALDGADMRLQA
jgi:DNA replication protein DnaC